MFLAPQMGGSSVHWGGEWNIHGCGEEYNFLKRERGSNITLSNIGAVGKNIKRRKREGDGNFWEENQD